jgi:hypothetical protein
MLLAETATKLAMVPCHDGYACPREQKWECLLVTVTMTQGASSV